MKKNSQIKRIMSLKKKRHKAHDKFFVKKKHITRWFKIINQEIFDNKLKPFRKIIIKRCRGSWAFAEGIFHKNLRKSCCLTLNLYVRSLPHFVEVLAHEMIHSYQWIYHTEMTHGQTFFEWKEKFNQFNLRCCISLR